MSSHLNKEKLQRNLLAQCISSLPIYKQRRAGCTPFPSSKRLYSIPTVRHFHYSTDYIHSFSRKRKSSPFFLSRALDRKLSLLCYIKNRFCTLFSRRLRKNVKVSLCIVGPSRRHHGCNFEIRVRFRSTFRMRHLRVSTAFRREVPYRIAVPFKSNLVSYAQILSKLS